MLKRIYMFELRLTSYKLQTIEKVSLLIAPLYLILWNEAMISLQSSYNNFLAMVEISNKFFTEMTLRALKHVTENIQ